MDGLTFGVISGVAYACFDTLVRDWSLLTGGIAQIDPGRWVALIFLEGFLKPLIIGTATGLACAEFSGLGRGYDGFKPRYFGGLASAIVANIAYQAGAYLFFFVGSPTLGATLQILWALIILGVLLLRLRVVLHAGLMEAALEASARQGSPGATGELQFCAHCEMPLIDNASFCNACGTAIRLQRKTPRPEPAAVAGAGPNGPLAPSEQVPAGSPAGQPTPTSAPRTTEQDVGGSPTPAARTDDVYDQFADSDAQPPSTDEEGRS